jgi:hypothetical protein
VASPFLSPASTNEKSFCCALVSTSPRRPSRVLLAVYWLQCMCLHSIASKELALTMIRLTRIPEWGVESMRIHTWRNIFFFEGILTMIAGLLAPIIMPTTPGETWFLNERERRIAVERLISKTGAEENEKVDWNHIKRSLFNINNYICAFGFFFINITVQGISLFLVREHLSPHSSPNQLTTKANHPQRPRMDRHKSATLLRPPLCLRLRRRSICGFSLR